MTDQTTTVDPHAARQQRGIVIAATCRLRKKGGVWIVPSQSGKGHYTVCPDKEAPHCSCPDHEALGCKCKHIFAVEIVIQRELFPDGSVQETKSVTITETRRSYPQKWAQYNAAQVNEKATFQVLLRDLCRDLPERPKTNGRQWLPMPDAIFAAVFKVYTTLSARRFMTDLRDAHAKGYIGKLPCYNSVLGVLESEDVFPILRSMVERSAEPLKPLESTFACDSSGFSGCRYDKWYDHKFGDRKIVRAWIKAHVMSGTKTNCITAVEIFDQHANDGPQLPALLDTTSKRFQVDEVCADLAYSTRNNLWAIDELNARALIPFKSNATPAAGGLWAKLYHYFNLHRDEFLSRYHQRSNVESTFSAVKRLFGDSVRAKTNTAMKNEVLAKFVCHNLTCVIHEIHESGIDPTCWAESRVAQQVVAG